MCLLIQKPAAVRFHETWLEDFWIHNRDGAGVMWTDKSGAVRVEKILSPSVAEWIRFYRAHAERRACLIHLRMRTHGAVSFENVHPYEVGGGVWLMHNGVLRFGNAADPSRSDTWHFIRDRLSAPISKNPDLIHNPLFISGMGKLIGAGNRFALLGRSGKPVLINRHTGFEWGGAWFSNTYAWDSESAEGLKKAA